MRDKIVDEKLCVDILNEHFCHSDLLSIELLLLLIAVKGILCKAKHCGVLCHGNTHCLMRFVGVVANKDHRCA